MSKLFLAAALALAVLAGCSASERSDAPMWRGDARFSAAERRAIAEGEAWIAAQGGHEPGGVAFDLVVDDAAPPEPRTIRRGRGPGPKGGATGECFGGAVYLGLEGNALVNEPPLRPEMLPGLVAHEMAHCRYGFSDAYHKDDAPSDGIMRNLAPMRWTEAEEAQCRATDCRAPGR